MVITNYCTHHTQFWNSCIVLMPDELTLSHVSSASWSTFHWKTVPNALPLLPRAQKTPQQFLLIFQNPASLPPALLEDHWMRLNPRLLVVALVEGSINVILLPNTVDKVLTITS